LSRGPKWKIEVYFFPLKNEPTLYLTFLGVYALTIQKQKPYIVHLLKTFFNDSFAQKIKKNNSLSRGPKWKIEVNFFSMKKGTHFISDLPGCVWFNYSKTKTIHCILMKNIFQWQVCSKGKKKAWVGVRREKMAHFCETISCNNGKKLYLRFKAVFVSKKKQKTVWDKNQGTV